MLSFLHVAANVTGDPHGLYKAALSELCNATNQYDVNMVWHSYSECIAIGAAGTGTRVPTRHGSSVQLSYRTHGSFMSASRCAVCKTVEAWPRKENLTLVT